MLQSSAAALHDLQIISSSDTVSLVARNGTRTRIKFALFLARPHSDPKSRGRATPRLAARAD